MARAQLVIRRLSAAGALCLSAWLWAAPLDAAPYGRFNRAHEDWKVTETAYFRFYFTEHTPRTTAYLLSIADETYERLNAFYGYEPARKITVTIVGKTAFANGFADSTRNRITIFPTPPNFHLRNRVHWLKNVFTHELSHILSLNTAGSWYNKVPLSLGIGITRTPRSQSSTRVPVYGRNYPHWFVEGVAQFDTFLLERDAFDESRRAFQRAAVEEGLFYPLGRLAFFGGERWYNSGLSFLLFLEDEFGPGTVHRLYRAAGNTYYYHFDDLFEDLLGVPLAELGTRHHLLVARRFARHLASVHGGLYDGEPLRFEDQQPYRTLAPREREYLSDDYSATPLRFIDGKLFYRAGDVISYGDFSFSERTVTHTESLGKGAAFAPQTDSTFFVLRQDHESPSLLPYFYRPDFESRSLFLVDTDEDERLLAEETRLMDFDACASRSELAGVYNDGDGSLKLALIPVEHFGSPEVRVRMDRISFPLPELPFDEVRDPRYSPDCSRIVFSRRVGDDHDVFAYLPDSGRLLPVSEEAAFELYPEPTAEGIYYVSSRDGVMNVYFRSYDGGAPVRASQAVTAHHHVVHTAGGLFFGRLYSTGFQPHFLSHAATNAEPVVRYTPKRHGEAREQRLDAALGTIEDYSGFTPTNLLAPSFVPILEIEYDSNRSFGSAFRLQAGVELFVEDQLRQHSLLLRGLAGSRSNFFAVYANRMTPLTLQLRAGMTAIRSVFEFEGSSEVFEHVTDYRWGFLSALVSLPLNLYHTATLFAGTTRDIGTTVGAETRPYDFFAPRFGRDLYGAFLDYEGIDDSVPNFREREINRRGFRRYTLRAFYGREHVHPSLAQPDGSIRTGVQSYARTELSYTEYLALPTLLDGFFDHTLQIDIQLGYISHDIRFLPFIGGGRLYSLTSPELNTSVGFAGYSFFSFTGETLLSLGVTYRFPIARSIGWDWGPLYLEDVYAQVFTSWGNIWGYDDDGRRQLPFRDRASNGRHLLGDVGIDLRLGHFIQELEGNVGTTLRAVYRLVPFRDCPGADPAEDPGCLGVDAERGFMFYFIVGGGF